MLLTELVEQWGLPNRPNEELTQEIIANLLKLILVCAVLLLFFLHFCRKELR